MSAAQSHPICLVLTPAGWLIGPTQDVDRARVRVEPVYHYSGAVVVQPSASTKGSADVSLPKEVKPVEGLISLQGLTVHPTAVVSLAELGEGDREAILREYQACETIVRGIRRSMGLGGLITVEPSRLVLAGGGR